jgi:hypothetical protein
MFHGLIGHEMAGKSVHLASFFFAIPNKIKGILGSFWQKQVLWKAGALTRIDTDSSASGTGEGFAPVSTGLKIAQP